LHICNGSDADKAAVYVEEFWLSSVTPIEFGEMPETSIGSAANAANLAQSTSFLT